jgi:hypothetical protein
METQNEYNSNMKAGIIIALCIAASLFVIGFLFGMVVGVLLG